MPNISLSPYVLAKALLLYEIKPTTYNIKIYSTEWSIYLNEIPAIAVVASTSIKIKL